MIIVNTLPVKDDLSGMPMIKSEEQAILYKSECHFVVPFDKKTFKLIKQKPSYFIPVTFLFDV